MKMKKKWLSLLFAILVGTLITVPAFAAGVVNVYNWQDYICEDALALFEEETGIKVNYMAFTTNEDMMVQVRAQPSAFDVIFPSDYCIERLITDGLLETLDFNNIPNFSQIIPSLICPAYDPGNAYSVPYMWGTVGILYNATMVDEPVDSWAVLWDENYQNNVFMYDSIRDTMGVALKYLGYSMNTRDPFELEEAQAILIEQKRSGVVKAYQVDEIKDKMVAGEGALALMWSGDAQYAIDLNEDLAYVVPREGSNIWVDGMVIPKGAKNRENAEIFIDFLCRPDIARMNCEEIWYSSPNTGAIEQLGDEYRDNLTMNPTEDIIDRCEFFMDLGEFTAIYNALWLEIKNTR
jgi:spermidine/putrescine-binding protein